MQGLSSKVSHGGYQTAPKIHFPINILGPIQSHYGGAVYTSSQIFIMSEHHIQRIFRSPDPNVLFNSSRLHCSFRISLRLAEEDNPWDLGSSAMSLLA